MIVGRRYFVAPQALGRRKRGALRGDWTLCKMVLGKEHDGSVRNLRGF
jgi:hypothetical protein